MNNRARNRLMGVTAIIIVIAAAVFFSGILGGSAYSKTVKEVASDKTLVDKRVRVTGSVVAGSWDKRTNPMVFSIRSEGATSGPEIKVIYSGAAPNTFGNDTVAIVTGTLQGDRSLKADDMITKCPSKYQSKSGADDVTTLLKEPTGVPIMAHGFLKNGTLKDAGAAVRFYLATTATGGDEVPVKFEGAMPDGTKDGVQLVVEGKLQSGTFVATQVSISK
jgi:cytochrome c-type biogenesis protein CcmE